MERTRAKPMKVPPAIQVARVRTVVAWRPPRIPSVAAAPPPIAARPPPFPDWRRITTPRNSPSSTRRPSRKPYITSVPLECGTACKNLGTRESCQRAGNLVLQGSSAQTGRGPLAQRLPRIPLPLRKSQRTRPDRGWHLPPEPHPHGETREVRRRSPVSRSRHRGWEFRHHPPLPGHRPTFP